MNQLVPADQTSTREIGIAVGAGGASIAPQNLGEVVRFAEVMCRADIALPKHLRGNAGACMAVALQALEWQMSPFAVASKSYAVNGAIAYEAQLIAAVVNTRSGIKGRLRYEFIGEGNDLSCKVTGVLDGQECEYETPPIGAITTKNSPLWKSDPRQQLGYFAARSWARRHCPEVILGVYDRDEAENFGPTNAKDVTPSVMSRLQARQEAPQAREGFDQSFVTRETAALTGEADSTQTEDNSQSSATSTDEGSADASTSSVGDPAADNSDAGNDGVDEGAGDIGAADGQSASSAPDLSDEDRAWLLSVAKQLWAATGVGEQDLVSGVAGDLRNSAPLTTSQAARDKAGSVLKQCKLVCYGEQDAADTLELIAGIVGVETREIV
ncbi:recombinase RecT [Aquamicrobium soli]|uniref:Recombinase RecT n=1 Tax=Aquamicrobium soli TaxID=1811518 RepID=A0ABV7KER1_9HYPH